MKKEFKPAPNNVNLPIPPNKDNSEDKIERDEITSADLGDKISVLGQGSFGSVTLFRLKNNPQKLYAVKHFFENIPSGIIAELNYNKEVS